MESLASRSTETDREIVISRMIEGPPDLVFEAFTDPGAVEGGEQTLGRLAEFVAVRAGAAAGQEQA